MCHPPGSPPKSRAHWSDMPNGGSTAQSTAGHDLTPPEVKVPAISIGPRQDSPCRLQHLDCFLGKPMNAVSPTHGTAFGLHTGRSPALGLVGSALCARQRRLAREGLCGQRCSPRLTTAAAAGASNGNGARPSDAAANGAYGQPLNGTHAHRQRRSHNK